MHLIAYYCTAVHKIPFTQRVYIRKTSNVLCNHCVWRYNYCMRHNSIWYNPARVLWYIQHRQNKKLEVKLFMSSYFTYIWSTASRYWSLLKARCNTYNIYRCVNRHINITSVCRFRWCLLIYHPRLLQPINTGKESLHFVCFKHYFRWYIWSHKDLFTEDTHHF